MFVSHELLLAIFEELHFLHFMASSTGIVIVLAINDCASSITGDLVFSVSLTWLAPLLGVPRVVGALATCRVTLLEGPPD